MSFLLVRSPEAPKMTIAHGSGVRSRRRPWASGLSAAARPTSLVPAATVSRGCAVIRSSASRGHQLAVLGADPFEELAEGIAELLHALLLEREHHVVVVDAYGGDPLQDATR